jgi:hypothetical protein
MQVQMLVSAPAALPVTAVAGSPPVVAAAASAPLRELPGPLAILRDAIRADGMRGLWLGQTGTLIRETGGSAAWFGTKELVCKLLRRGDAPHAAAPAVGERAERRVRRRRVQPRVLPRRHGQEHDTDRGRAPSCVICHYCRGPGPAPAEVIWDRRKGAVSRTGLERPVCRMWHHGCAVGAQQRPDIFDIRWVKGTVWVENFLSPSPSPLPSS